VHVLPALAARAVLKMIVGLVAIAVGFMEKKQ
jgi:hypothetical protein